jgi:hypothetical protein
MSMTDTNAEPPIIDEAALLAREKELANAQAIVRKKDKGKIRGELASQAKKNKGTPKGTLYEYLGATEDYETALSEASAQIRKEREEITARQQKYLEESAQYQQGDNNQAALREKYKQQEGKVHRYEGQGGPLLSSEDGAVAYAQAVEAGADDELAQWAAEANEDEPTQQEAKAAPKPTMQGVGQSMSNARPRPGETPAAPGPSIGTDFTSTAGSVAGDIAVGIAESPGAIARGVWGAADELLDTIDSAGAWVAINGARFAGDEAGAAGIEKQRAEGATALGGLMDAPSQSSSVTGGIIQGIAQFVTGYAAGGKALQSAGLLGRVGKTGDVLLKSAFADAFAFDPAQQRLSNLIQENPALENPVTEFLASKPGDSEAVGRFKNAIEGLGIGVALQGAFVMGLKGLRALKSMNPPPPTPAQVQAQINQALAPIGNPSAPALTVRKTPTGGVSPQDLTGYVNIGAKGDQSVFINMARIETADDVKDILQKSANLFKEDIAEAQRGVQSFEETAKLADDLGMSVDELLSRPRGANNARTPFTAEEALAARRLYTASGEKLIELAKAASAPLAGPNELFNFRKAMAVHHAIQAEVIGARTETARALSSWRIGADGAESQLKAIEAAMDLAGPDSVNLAKQLVTLQAAGATPGAINKFVRQSSVGTVGQMIRTTYTNGILSGVTTHLANIVGNFGTLGLSVLERKMGEKISRGITKSGAIVDGEAKSMLWGVLAAQREAFGAAWHALKTGESTNSFGKIEAARPSPIRSTSNNAFGTAVNVIGAAIELPGRLMLTADQWYRVVNYRANLHSLAKRQVESEGLSGAAAAKRYKDIVNNPPESLSLESSEHALTNTFNNKMGQFGQSLMNLREQGGVLNVTWLFATFIRTPVNIFRYSMERTPLAPLVGQWRADFAAGGARRDMALARVATGTMVMGVGQSLVDTHMITGSAPSDMNEAANWRRLGIQPYSIKVGDTYYSYSRMDPFGMVLGFAADVQQALRRGEVSPKDVDEWQEVMAEGIAAVSNTVMDKSFMSSYTAVIEAMSEPERFMQSLIRSKVTGFIPYSALLGNITRITDEGVQRDVRTPMDAIMARIPNLAARVIPKRDLWGKVIQDENVVQNTFSPMRASEEADAPIDREIDRLGAFPEVVGWKSSIDGVAVDFSDHSIALDEYRRLAGNGWKHPAWGVGLKDFLDQVVTGQHPLSQIYKMYSDGEQGGKAAFIRKAVQEYRAGAAKTLLADPAFREFRSYYEEEKAIQTGQRRKINF